MTGVVLAFVWCGAVFMALMASAVFERRARVFPRPDRHELIPPREFWGGDPRIAPVSSLLVRGLADFARMARSESRVEDHRPGLKALGQFGSALSLATGLAMIPFAGTWGGGAGGDALVPLDLSQGLVAFGLLFLITGFCRVALALSERSTWSRIAGARQASRSMAGLALLTLVLAPIAVDSGSLRLHEIVVDQQRPLAVVDWLLALIDADFAQELRGWPWPAWNLFSQPLTALLFIPAISLLLGSPRADDPATGSVAIAGLGLDADPVDLYWMKLETRLATVLGAALFVTLFLGAGSIPFVDSSALVPLLSPFVGEGLPTILLAAVHAGAFLMKWLLILGIAARMKRVAASARDDRALRLATRRLLPLAWANLLLVTAVALWFDAQQGGLG
jgi:NADH:ubiquinone oxidoreductase subunit H